MAENLDPKKIENILALTPMQEGMLFHYLKAPGSGIYFEQLSIEIGGEIDRKRFEKAWNIVVQANEMLRTVFRWEKLEKPSQIILKEYQCKIKLYDFSNMDNGQMKTALEKIRNNDRDEGFDLTHVPFRVILSKLSETQYEMVISNHHILYDGWSNGIILKEFFSTYHSLSKGVQILKLPAKSSFKEYIKWLQSRDKNKQEHYWREYLADFETSTELPIKKRVERAASPGDYSIILEEDIKNKLDIFAKNNRITLASVFYTAWGILLKIYCSSEDVVFGTTVSGRSAGIKGIEDMVGLFINTIPLRVQSVPSLKIIDIISGVENVLKVRAEFECTPLPDIKNYSTLSREGGTGSLFDTIVAMENYPLDSRLLPEDSRLLINSYSAAEMTHYDLTVGIMPFNRVELKFFFNQGIFTKEAIENLAFHFINILQSLIDNPGAEISSLEIITIAEKHRLLYEFNNPTLEYPINKTIHQLFAEQVEKSPDCIAVFGHGQIPATLTAPDNNVGADPHVCPVQNVRNVSLTYRQLNEQSDRLAGLLLEKGVLADSIAGIMMKRSADLIIGIIGILKCGAAYLPIDTNSPEERIEYMLRDSSAA
ncbi:MAG TPA: condensation domain-containing protein, partial [Candidatus Deferrimicrobium sp.]|nr:condensation domain-containing protein [Candidatus Deferrimicrobium sp.]